MTNTITLVTSFSPEGWVAYGHRMIESACQHLSDTYRIIAYHNDSQPNFTHPRVTFVNNYAIKNGVRTFLDRHEKDRRLWGKVPGTTKENFRYAINRFAHKQYAFYDAMRHTTAEIVVYVDADVVFFAPIPEDFFAETLPPGYYLSTLDRGPAYHFETGWLAVRRTHPSHKEFMERYIDFCRRDLFLREKEYHDAWLTTILARQMEREGRIAIRNLSPGYVGSGHPWLISRLAEFSDHCKGRRKDTGKSWKEDMHVVREEAYWQDLPSRNG